jgi:hypothetical protein
VPAPVRDEDVAHRVGEEGIAGLVREEVLRLEEASVRNRFAGP